MEKEWISVKDGKPEYGDYVLCLFENKTGEVVQCVVNFVSQTVHAFENSPMVDKFYAFPGWGHEIHPTYWMPLPEPPNA